MVARTHTGRIVAAPLRSRLLSGSARSALLMATALGIVFADDTRVEAALLNVGTGAALDAALASAQPGDTIVFTNDITLGANLANTATTNITINGNNHTLSGAGSFRGLSVQSLTTTGINVTIENLTIENSKVQGGNGGFGGKDGGGGGAGGIGGALGIGSNVNVTLSNVSLVSNIAQGGNGGTGGQAGSNLTFGGGGGGLGGNGSPSAGAPGFAPPGPGFSFAGTGGDGGINNGGQAGSGALAGGGGGTLVLTPTTSTQPVGGQGGLAGGGGSALTPGKGGLAGGNGDAVGNGGGGGALGGAIFIEAGGTLTVAGPLTINGNTVAAGQPGGGSATGGLALGSGIFQQGNGTIVFAPTTGATQTIADVITDQSANGGTGTNAGSLGITVNGAGGILLLSGANTYTGATTVSAGTLRAGATDAFSPNSPHIVAAGALLDLSSFNQQITSLSGAGSVSLGSATLTLGDNTNTVFSGVIAGTGGVVKTGSGTLALSGNSTFTGTTTISAGTLQLGAGGTSGSLAGNIVDNATLAFDRSDTLIYSNSISGSGGLMVSGGGTLILDGVNTYAGPTTIGAGTLEVGDANSPGASITSNVTVSAGGMLAGHGSVLGTVSNLGGVVQPGGSVGVLTVNSYVQSASGTFQVEVTPTAASQLHVTGQANLAGTVSLIFDPGVYNSKTFPILTAAGITGNFTAVNSTLPATALGQSVVRNAAATEIDLVLSGSATVTPPVPPPAPVDPPPIITLPPPAPIVIAPTNDTIWTALATAAIEQSHDTSAMIFDRLSSMRPGGGNVSAGTAPRQQAFAGGPESLDEFIAQAPVNIANYGGWFRAGGSFTSVQGNGLAPGFQANGGGFIAGIDRPIADNAVLGIAAGYARTAVSERTGADGTFEAPYASLYGGAVLGPIDLDASLGSGYYTFSTGRPTPLGPAASSPNGFQVSSAVQASYPMSIANFRVTPKLGAQFVHLTQDGFSESGAGGFDLTGSNVGTDSLRPFVAASATSSRIIGGAEVTPELRLGYSREVLSAVRSINVTTVSGTPFLVFGVSPGRNEGTVGAGLSTHAIPGVTLSANYDAAIFGNQLSQVVTANFNVRF